MGLIERCKSDAPLIMGIVNVTSDSFSDGGQFLDTDRAIAHGIKLLEEGADILDIGGESTRPNAEPVTIDEELERVIPVIQGLAAHASFISIDTRNAEVMQAAIEAGANVINDVSALTHDTKSAAVVSQSALPVCLMHMKGTPQTMQDKPHYDNVVDEILSFFEQRLEFCAEQGIEMSRVILDPGIGFGKTVDHNLSIIKNVAKFKTLGCPVLLGVSRKSFIGTLCQEDNPKNRVSGSLSAALYALEQGIEIFRVHDVQETKQAFTIHHAIRQAS